VIRVSRATAFLRWWCFTSWCRAIDREDYLVKLSAGFTILLSVTAFLAQSLYRGFFESVIKLALSEEYSYILVSFFTVIAVVYLSIRYVGFSYSVRLSKVLASSFLAVLAVSTYLLSRFNPEHYVHLQGLSFAFFFVSTAVLVYDPTSPAHIIPMVTVFLLIPLPTSVVDSVTPVFSRVIGRVVAVLTGSRLVETPGYVMLEVTTPSGVHLLSVEAACTGIVTLSSVVAVVPVLALLASLGRARMSKKVLVSLVATASALALGFLGNLMRVLLVVYTARSADIETAMAIFHYSPSAIYSSISVLVAFLVVSKYGKLEAVSTARRGLTDKLDVSWSYVLGVLTLALVMVSAVSSATLAVESTLATSGSSLSVEAEDFESLLENPAAYFSTGGVTYLSAYYDSYLTRVLGALAVYNVVLEFSGGIYRGYLEIVDTSAKLHTWQLCLSVQGYRVTKSWSRSYGALQVSYVVAERGEEAYLLTYTLLPTTVRSGVADYSLFTRISVFTPFEDLATAVDDSTKLIMAIAGEGGKEVELQTEAVSVLLTTSYSLLATLVAYLLFVSARHALHRTKPRGYQLDMLVQLKQVGGVLSRGSKHLL